MENPNPNLLSEQIIQVLISFKHYLVFLPIRLNYCVRQLCGSIFRGEQLVSFLLIISEETLRNAIFDSLKNDEKTLGFIKPQICECEANGVRGAWQVRSFEVFISTMQTIQSKF